MRYLDTVKIATISSDGYGDKTVTELADCPALFVKRSGVNHELNADGIVSDAAVYLDPTNVAVTANLEKLEGMYILTGSIAYGEGQYGNPFYENWYRIDHVNIAERKLLNNALDNVYCLLSRQPGVAYVTAIS